MRILALPQEPGRRLPVLPGRRPAGRLPRHDADAPRHGHARCTRSRSTRRARRSRRTACRCSRSPTATTTAGPGYGKDSRLVFDPPADGEYQVRVSDAGGAGGPTHAYRLTVRPPRPDFTVRFNPTAPTVWKGGAVPGRPSPSPGSTGSTARSTCGSKGCRRVPAPRRRSSRPASTTTAVALFAAGTRPMPAKLPTLKLVARADDRRQGGRPRGGRRRRRRWSEPGDLVTTTSLSELVIRPGGEVRAAGGDRAAQRASPAGCRSTCAGCRTASAC